MVILAAGASKRMGTPKQLLAWGKDTLIVHVITQALKTEAMEVIVNLKGIDLKKGGRQLNVDVTLPHSTGEGVKVAVIGSGNFAFTRGISMLITSSRILASMGSSSSNSSCWVETTMVWILTGLFSSLYSTVTCDFESGRR